MAVLMPGRFIDRRENTIRERETMEAYLFTARSALVLWDHGRVTLTIRMEASLNIHISGLAPQTFRVGSGVQYSHAMHSIVCRGISHLPMKSRQIRAGLKRVLSQSLQQGKRNQYNMPADVPSEEL